MDLLTQADIRSLTQDAASGPQVSLFMPTHRVDAGAAGDRLRWKTLITRAESALEKDLRRPPIQDLLAPACSLESDGLAWQYMSDGLAMFLHAGGHRVFRLPLELPELVAVGDRPVIGPLLPMLSGDEHFLLLALSQRDIRLMEGTRFTVEQVDLHAIPTSLRDVVKVPESRTETMARPASVAGRGGPAVFYGHGALDENVKQDGVQRFLRQVSGGLAHVLAGVHAPMVMVGLDHLVNAYRDVNTYPNLVDEALLRNPDESSPEQLHALAWPVVEQRAHREQAALVDQFYALNGTGRASSAPEVVSEAAAQGRVETLIVGTNPSCWDRLATSDADAIRLGDNQRSAMCERLDTTALDTLNSGGKVFTMPGPLTPGDELAAIFRF